MAARMPYERLAALLDYPGEDYLMRVSAAREVLDEGYPGAVPHLAAFQRALPAGGPRLAAASLDAIQEIFTRSFDVQSITTLGVGYVMFGDDYKRGELLVNLSRELDDAGVECGTELPDHLPVVLRLVARWENQALVQEFVEEILYPALRMMIEEFGPERIAQRNQLYQKHFKTVIVSSEERATMFREPLAALVAVLEADFTLTARPPATQDNDFLRFVGRELDIEMTEGRPVKTGSLP